MDRGTIRGTQLGGMVPPCREYRRTTEQNTVILLIAIVKEKEMQRVVNKRNHVEISPI